ncbi:MAG: sugar phosphate isomerase/epimerase [Provencibacterium sp.]|nr:sugar phosphate isomerase/epimerase [Provencibacterium sp.]
MLICVQTGGVSDELGFERGCGLLRESGFEGIDWNINRAWDQEELRAGKLSGCIFEKPLPEILAYYREDLEAIRKNGLAISQAHAPFPAHIRGVPELEPYAVEIFKGCIRLCDAVDCNNLIIHGISVSPGEPELSYEDVERLNFRIFEPLIPLLSETNVTVCLENLFATVDGRHFEGTCSNPQEAVRLIDTLNERAGKECFGLCLDTGHLNLLRKNIREYVRVLGPRIKALHIHDNDGSRDEHLMPFTGTVRWNDFTSALKEVGYTGDLSFETFNQVKSPRMDAAYIPIFLRAIYGVGEIFRERIQGI